MFESKTWVIPAGSLRCKAMPETEKKRIIYAVVQQIGGTTHVAYFASESVAVGVASELRGRGIAARVQKAYV